MKKVVIKIGDCYTEQHRSAMRELVEKLTRTPMLEDDAKNLVSAVTVDSSVFSIFDALSKADCLYCVAQ